MEWLEIIKVRAVGGKQLGMDTEIHRLLEEVLESPGLERIRVYGYASLLGDRMIVLRWDTNPPRSEGSDLAYSLTSEMRRYGPVDHSVWIRTPTEAPCDL